MLNKIELSNFKLHQRLDLKMAPVTIMTGMNGMGKSSVIQALLLLRQSAMSGVINNGVTLNGLLCEIGAVKDLFCESAEGENVNINLSFEPDISANFRLAWDNDHDTFMRYAADPIDYDTLKEEALFSDSFQYISAFRFGPQRMYGIDTVTVKLHRQLSEKLGQCEYAVDYLYEFGKEKVLPQLFYDGTTETQLEDQVANWMSAIASKMSVHIRPQGVNSLELSYGYQGKTSRMEVSAMNTGFGLSYVLPIVVAILSAKSGSLIVIENPEAHIHPKAQSVLMRLIATAAKSGIQFIIETHSDHVINGLMVSVANGVLLPKDISLNFFRMHAASQISELCPMVVTSEGRIKNAPKDFFDQIDIDLQTIMGF